MDEIIFYNSPIGMLQIRNSGDAISELSFVNTKSRNTINEKDIECTLPSSQLLKKCILQLDEYFGGTRFNFDLNIEQPGTIFQQKVWSQLLKIKYGATVSYLHLSKALGDTKAIRAVGTANGRNNIAIIVPCHRVIGSDGTLVGYGGDLWRKKWLLEHEAKHANGVQTLF